MEEGSTSNQSTVFNKNEMLHIHIFFVAPLRTGNMAQASAYQHESGVAIGKCADHPCSAANFTVEAFDNVICANPCPMLEWEIGIGQCFFNSILYFICTWRL